MDKLCKDIWDGYYAAEKGYEKCKPPSCKSKMKRQKPEKRLKAKLGEATEAARAMEVPCPDTAELCESAHSLDEVFGVDWADAKYAEIEELERKQSEPPDISVLGFSLRVYNILMRAGYRRVSDLLQVTEDDILALDNIGKCGYEEIKRVMQTNPLLANAKAVFSHSSLFDAGYRISSAKARIRKQRQEQAEKSPELSASAVSYELISGETSIADIGFSHGAKYALVQSGYMKASDLLELSNESLIGLKGVGFSVFNNIKSTMQQIPFFSQMAEEFINSPAIKKYEFRLMKRRLAKANAEEDEQAQMLKNSIFEAQDISILNLSYRFELLLRDAGYRKISDLMLAAEDDILSIEGIGAIAFLEIKSAMLANPACRNSVIVATEKERVKQRIKALKYE